jgi:hypothetical protein
MCDIWVVPGMGTIDGFCATGRARAICPSEMWEWRSTYPEQQRPWLLRIE